MITFISSFRWSPEFSRQGDGKGLAPTLSVVEILSAQHAAMPEFLCRTRYSVLLDQSDLKGFNPGPCMADAEEMREPDAWGDPGRLVSRRWVKVLANDGRDYVAEVVRSRYRIRPGMELIGALAWDGFEGGEVGA